MAYFPEVTDPKPGDGITRSVLWPFGYMPLLWILLIHVGTRFMWFLGYR